MPLASADRRVFIEDAAPTPPGRQVGTQACRHAGTQACRPSADSGAGAGVRPGLSGRKYILTLRRLRPYGMIAGGERRDGRVGEEILRERPARRRPGARVAACPRPLAARRVIPADRPHARPYARSRRRPRIAAMPPRGHAKLTCSRPTPRRYRLPRTVATNGRARTRAGPEGAHSTLKTWHRRRPDRAPARACAPRKPCEVKCSGAQRREESNPPWRAVVPNKSASS